MKNQKILLVLSLLCICIQVNAKACAQNNTLNNTTNKTKNVYLTQVVTNPKSEIATSLNKSLVLLEQEMTKELRPEISHSAQLVHKQLIAKNKELSGINNKRRL